MEKENAYMQRMIDWKRVWMLLSKKIWIVVVATIAGAVIGGIGYKLVDTITSEGQYYRVSSDYYITFNEDENGADHYNAYTWDTILRDDPVVDVVMEYLPSEITRAQVREAVTGEMLGDYRILTVYVDSLDPQFAETVADAYEKGLAAFADKISMLDTIERWSREDVTPIVDNDYMINVALFSGATAFVVTLLLMAFFYILDDSIYIENDFAQGFHIPFLGMLTKNGSDACKQELKDNLIHLCKADGTYYLVSWDNKTDSVTEDALKELLPAICGKISVQGEDLNALRNSDGAIIVLPWGSKNGRITDKLIRFLEKQDCKITGAVLTNADDVFLKAYYFGKTKRK